MRKAFIYAVAALTAMTALCPAISAQGIQFNPEPITGNRALGISVGVVTKQLAQGDIKMPWMYLDYLSGDSKAKQSAARVPLRYRTADRTLLRDVVPEQDHEQSRRLSQGLAL